jgi:hypothetical protein
VDCVTVKTQGAADYLSQRVGCYQPRTLATPLPEGRALLFWIWPISPDQDRASGQLKQKAQRRAAYLTKRSSARKARRKPAHSKRERLKALMERAIVKQNRLEALR